MFVNVCKNISTLECREIFIMYGKIQEKIHRIYRLIPMQIAKIIINNKDDYKKQTFKEKYIISRKEKGKQRI